ncbi:GNAT family protein [Lacibacter sp. MH-610]|uniref:GNAT family N-acetyltransferase n=1 Tax=Lacibacter sp. MH-610 TaxID=3020883 RepID=UPI0038914DA5
MIRHATTADFEFIFELYMHPAINPWLLYEPMDAVHFQPIFQELLERKVLYVFEVAEIPVGMCKLVPEEHRSAHVLYVGGIGIHPSFAGNGYGVQLMEAIKLFADAEGYRRLELSVAAINEKAMHVYEKAGFLKEGILRKYTYQKAEDRYLDEVMMSCLL